jgi:hypothetical protein
MNLRAIGLAVVCALAAACGEATAPTPTLKSADTGGGDDAGQLSEDAGEGAEDGAASAEIGEAQDTGGGETAGAADTVVGAPDLPAADDVGEPAGCPGAAGCACQIDTDCEPDGACLPAAAGLACAAPCKTDTPCPGGFKCVPLAGAAADGSEDKAVCAPKWPSLCDPCTSSATCKAEGMAPPACVGKPGPGYFCASACKADKDCPDGYACQSATTIEGGEFAGCVRKSGECGCSDAAVKAKLSTVCQAQGSGGVACAGKRTCGPSGLSVCSASTPGAETCNGMDDDCDGQTDEGVNCDDGQLCTSDACSGGTCAHAPNSVACDDGDPCTEVDGCQNGACKGKSAACDDSNPCTKDACGAGGCSHTVADQLPCEDGDACTGPDLCFGGKCLSGNAQCPCKSTADCAAKEDGNSCNGTLVCAPLGGAMTCVVDPKTVVNCDASGNTACLANLCDPKSGLCMATAQGEGEPCDDGQACTAKDQCAAGVCQGSALNCDDGNSCTLDACEPAKGCTHSVKTGACSDGNACTTGDTCTGDKCAANAVTLCDDGFACTNDSCDPAVGCVNAPVADGKCGTVVPPDVTALGCKTGSNGLWLRSDTLAPAGTVRWDFDASPNPPGFLSPDCALNVNNGKDLACGPGQPAIAATADSPWYEASGIAKNAPLRLRFASAGLWIGQTAKVKVRAKDAAGWTEVLTLAPGAGWTVQTIELNPWAGMKFQVRFEFAGPCGGSGTGWFVDDLALAVDPCANNNGGCGEQVCSIGPDGKAACNACPPGSTATGGKCVDKNECLQTPSPCSPQADCKDLPGSFQCTCKAGFAGNGFTCEPADPCAALTCTDGKVCSKNGNVATCACPAHTLASGATCVKKGGAQNWPAQSCLEVWTLFPDSTNGSYWLDFDGPGALPVGQYLCDMTGGGWTQLYADEFDDGKATGWSVPATSACGKFAKILGGVNVLGKGSSATKSVPAPPHSATRGTLKYIRIDNWLSDKGQVLVDGAQVWSKTSGWLTTSNECGSKWYADEQWSAAWEVAHKAATVGVTVTADIKQKLVEKAWFGADSVVVWVK